MLKHTFSESDGFCTGQISFSTIKDKGQSLVSCCILISNRRNQDISHSRVIAVSYQGMRGAVPSANQFLPPVNEVWGKVMFLDLPVCSQEERLGGLHPGGSASDGPGSA